MPFCKANGFALSIPKTESWSVILMAFNPDFAAFNAFVIGAQTECDNEGVQ